MPRRAIALASLALLGAALFLGVGRAAEGAKPEKPVPKKRDKSLPKWSQVEAAAAQVLMSRDGYKPGDLIARSEAQAVMGRLVALGWNPDDSKEIVALVPADDDFIVKKLRGKDKDGQRFMRQVSKYPQGYDRLDRMVRLPRGQIFTADLIHNPGGYQMIEYMATAEGGIELGKMLSADPGGKNFNQPTGRLYTAEQLIARLRVSYERATADGEPTR